MTDGKTPHYHRVLDFMHRAKQECPLVPTNPPEKIRRLRATLILEEALETVKALGFSPQILNQEAGGWIPLDLDDLLLVPTGVPSLPDIVDGCADLSVVTIGTLIACGVHDEAVLELVDANNLQKFGPGHSWRADGKLLKPPGHRPPNFSALLLSQSCLP